MASVAWSNDVNDPGSPSKSKPKDVESLRNEKCNRVGISCRRKKFKFCWKYFTEFTGNTSLHGLKYLGEEKRSITEKIWWLLMIGLSGFACTYLILKLWTKWQQSPVIVSFAETSTPVWQIPFPAVTICSVGKILQTQYNFTEIYNNRRVKNMTEEEQRDYEIVSLVCENEIRNGKKVMNNNSLELLKKIAPKKDDVFIACQIKSKIKSCDQLFHPILTEEGYCYSYNMFNSEDLFRKENLHDDFDFLNHPNNSGGWSLGEGYQKNVPLNTYPVRGSGSGVISGLSIMMVANKEDHDFICGGPVEGFKVILHTPAEFPKVSQQFFRVPLNHEVVAAVKPNMMTTAEGLRDYEPKRRQCYFPSERKLKFFKVYTQQNCEIECLTNYTMHACDCVALGLPRDPSMPVCSSGSLSCTRKSRDRLTKSEIRHEIEEIQTRSMSSKKKKLQEIANNCDCRPACTSITYDAETSQASFNWDEYLTAIKLDLSHMENVSMASVSIFFKESQFITSRRSELYGQTDFLANCGGILGLFLGFSILSLIEIIYFFSLRIVCNVQKKKKMLSQSA